MNTFDAMKATGATYRQLDYWTSQGWIPGQGPLGPGNPRKWTPEQLERVRQLLRAALLRRGRLIDTVERLAELDPTS